MTTVDAAHAAMIAAPEDDAARLAFYARLAEAELHLLLEEEALGDDIAPRVLDAGGRMHVIAFDSPARLADYAGREAAYAALPGKALADMLAGQGIGLALNPDIAPSATLLPPEAVGWLADTLGDAPEEREAEITEIGPPGALPEPVLAALDGALARAAGLAEAVWLVEATEAGGRKVPLVAIIDPAPGAEGPLAQAIRDAIALSGAEAGFLDVAFFAREHPVVPVLKRQGLMFDLPEIGAAPAPGIPGLDSPPRLR